MPFEAGGIGFGNSSSQTGMKRPDSDVRVPGIAAIGVCASETLADAHRSRSRTHGKRYVISNE